MQPVTFKKKKAYIETLETAARRHSQWSDILSRLLRNKLGMFAFIIVAVLLLLIIFAGVLTWFPYGKQNFADRFADPSWTHLMGTDNLGRDMWSRLLFGGRISLFVALVAVAMSLTAGTILGSTAGYFGGKTDVIITRLLDILMAIPGLLLAIAISAMLGSGPFNTALAISISGMPGAARIIRSTVMTIKSNEFVEAARATGSTHVRVIFKHILPNAIAPLIVFSTLGIGGNIMAISGLSFIGLGVQPPIPEWGSILSMGRQYIRDYWPMTVFPGLFIMLTLFGFNLLGDALRDALDPKLKN
jgi:peptide/nickel transport system permease protein